MIAFHENVKILARGLRCELDFLAVYFLLDGGLVAVLAELLGAPFLGGLLLAVLDFRAVFRGDFRVVFFVGIVSFTWSILCNYVIF